MVLWSVDDATPITPAWNLSSNDFALDMDGASYFIIIVDKMSFSRLRLSSKSLMSNIPS